MGVRHHLERSCCWLLLSSEEKMLNLGTELENGVGGGEHFHS